jgi:hypothetical protein
MTDERDFNKLYEPLHRAILTGNLSGIAQRGNRFEYNVCGGGKFVLWPGSGLQKKNAGNKKDFGKDNRNDTEKNGLPHWIVAAERLETTRKFLRTAAQIDAAWIEPLAKHLIQRVYLEPHWNRETGYVHAYEKVTLFGIIIVPKRRINYGPIDPKTARNIFIQHALVEEDLQPAAVSRETFAFFVHNQQVLEEAKKLQDKLRQPGIIRPESVRYQFYQERIPDDVYDQRSLAKWIQNNDREIVQTLFMTLDDLCTENADVSAFPDQIQTFDIEYRYAPGSTEDGLTVIVPQDKIRQVEPARLGWLVPGLMEQKIAALLKSLPKDIRRQIVPIPDTVKDLMKVIRFGEGDLEGQICKEITRLAGRIVVPAHFNSEQLPPELQMNVRVLDHEGKVLGESKDFLSLRKEFVPMLQPAEKPVSGAENFYNAHKREIKTQIQYLPNSDKLKLYAKTLADFDFYERIGLLIAARALQSGGIVPAVQEVTKVIVPLLESYHQAKLAIEQNRSMSAAAAEAEHVQRLTSAGFLLSTAWNWLCEYPRYFRAVPLRFEKFRSGGEAADRQGVAELSRYWQQYVECRELHEAAGIADEELEVFRWMIEEYRVSLFAQRLGTAAKVSPQRLEKQFEKVKR